MKLDEDVRKYIANKIFGNLFKYRSREIYLLNIEVVEKANFSLIIRLFNSLMYLEAQLCVSQRCIPIFK